MNTTNINELYHYGVKGMKWGVRRYQNKDGSLTDAGRKRRSIHAETDDIVINKGTVGQRLSTIDNEQNNDRHTYVSFKRSDNEKYLKEWGLDGYKYQLKVTNDLIIPAYNKRNQLALQAIRNASLDKVYNDVNNPRYRNNAKALIRQVQDDTVIQLTDKAYKSFASSLTESEYNRKIFFDELKKNGYNAVIDDNDRGWTNMPVIVFNRKRNLATKSVTKIS